MLETVQLTRAEWDRVLETALMAREQWDQGLAHLAYKDLGPVPPDRAAHIKEQVSSHVMHFGLVRPLQDSRQELVEAPREIADTLEELLGGPHSRLRT